MFEKKNAVNELIKLAHLNARGAFNDGEYEVQKGKLIHGAARPKRRGWPWWNWALAIVIGIIYLGVKYDAPSDTPACDDESVRQKVVKLANRQSQPATESAPGPLLSAGTAGLISRVSAVISSRTLFHDKNSGFRACVGTASIEGGHGFIGYTVEWRDKANGEYIVQVSNAAVLAARYGGAAHRAASSNQ